jgi:formylglycine-generating enzyme
LLQFLIYLLVLILPATATASKRVAVLEFSSSGIEESIIRLLSDEVRAGLLKETRGRTFAGEGISVMTRENMLDMMEQMGKSPDCIQGSCEVALARNIGADFVVSGELVKLDALYVLSIKFHETRKGELLSVQGVREREIEELMDGARQAGRSMATESFGLPLNASATQVEEKPLGESASSWSAESKGSRRLVQFTSTPQGASVLVDGRMICKETPCKQYLEKGAHKVVFQKQRYGEAAYDFAAEKSTRLHAELSPLFGSLHVNSTPIGIEILLDGVSIGSTPLRGNEVTPGPHRLMSASPCHLASGYQFQLEAGESKTVDLTLQARRAGIEVYGYIDGNAVEGDVYVDGRKMGRTAQALEVPLCSERLEILTTGAKRLVGSLKLEENRTQSIELREEAAKEPAFKGIYPMTRIQAGEFRMGSEKGDSDELPVHTVRITRDFYIGTAEVTQGLWTDVVGSNISYFDGCGRDCPVENISWFEAVQFANALSIKEGLETCYEIRGKQALWNKGLDCTGYRLPTEAEWEYAARGGAAATYAGSEVPDQVAWYRENSKGSTHPVGRKAPNGYGLFDMSGNVWEWVWDWYAAGYGNSLSVQADPTGPVNGRLRVGRGGGWIIKPSGLRISFRSRGDPSYRRGDLGLRLARTAP